MNTVDEDLLKLPTEPPSLKVLGFVPSSTIARHLYMDDTFVLLPEPGSGQAMGAITSLARAMRNLDQVMLELFGLPSDNVQHDELRLIIIPRKIG